MNFLADNHTLAAIIAAIVCNGWVIWVTAQAYIAGIQSDIERANYRMRINQECQALIAEDEKEEIQNIINREWDI
ncbi:MAG: hypothetical protein HRU12_16975 [Phaeodactylibacter sp.]|nr:hypothetical protein [Phaeodactylibacter sp.]